MSAYKKLNQQDAYISTYTSRKSWVASGSQYKELGINNIVGLSGSGNYYSLNSGNVIAGNSQTTASSVYNRRLIYESIDHLYYKDFKDSVLITSSSYEAYLQSSYEVSGSRYLNDRFALFSLPKEMYGIHIEPYSVSITPDLINSGSEESGSFDNYVINNYSTEDGINSIESEFNLYIENTEFLFGTTGANCNPASTDYIENESNYVLETDPTPGEYLDTTTSVLNCNEIVDDGEGRLYFKYSSPRLYVGNVIYTHGQIIITNEIVAMYYNHYFDAVLRWKSNLPIFTHNYHCKLKANEFNYTLNKTALQTTDGQIADLISGSDFNPYITGIGLYNDANELIAVGKLGRPTPKSLETDMSIIVKLDMNFGSDRLVGERTEPFIPSDPEEDNNTPPDVVPCIHYFTFRNYYKKGSTGTNQTLHGSPYRVDKPQSSRKLIDNGDYVLYRKKEFDTDICKKSMSGNTFFDTSDFNIITNTTLGKTGLTSVCYVDVTATKVLDSNGNSYITFDFTQKEGGEYDETANINNRSKAFFRDIIRTYLLENIVNCEYTSIGTESCYIPIEM
jgi:hypothetical protein